MSNKTKSLVFGYVRNNYRLYVPEMIFKIILLFFDPETVIKFKGKAFQEFLKAPPGHAFKTTIKFNQDLAFHFTIYPNGPTTGYEGIVTVKLDGVMAMEVNYFAICHEILCVETQSLVLEFQKPGSENNYKLDGSWHWLKLSECKEQKELTFKLIIHSLEIKYENDKNNKHRLFYPSLNPRMLKKKTTLNWMVDTKRLNQFPKTQKISSKLKDNWNFAFWPNCEETMFLFAHLRSWPLDISKMVIMIKAKIVINSKTEHHESRNEFTLNEYNGNELKVRIFYNRTIDLEQIKDMTFDATIIVKQLYDMDNVEIPVEKWKDHNVETSNN